MDSLETYLHLDANLRRKTLTGIFESFLYIIRSTSTHKMDKENTFTL